MERRGGGPGRGRGKGCKNCGLRHAWGACPAYGKRCAKCSQFNHFAKMCPNQDYESDDYTERSDSPYQQQYESDSEYSVVRSEYSDTESTRSSVTSVQAKRPDGCYNCGFKHRRGQCPAYGKQCAACHKMNHFAQVCFSNPKNQVIVEVPEPENYQERNYSNHSNHLSPPSKYYRANGMATEIPRVQSKAAASRNTSQPSSSTPHYNHPNGAIPRHHNRLQTQSNQPSQTGGATPRTNDQQNKRNSRANNNQVINIWPQNNNEENNRAPQNNTARNPASYERDVSKCFLDKCTLNHDRVVKLHSCGHSFFRNCLAKAILESGQATMRCPSLQACTYIIPEAALGSILTREEYEIYKDSEQNFQCRTAGCDGWCSYRSEVMFFHCPKCSAVNCLLCKSIHSGGPCKKLDDILNYPAEDNTGTLKRMKNPESTIYPKLLDMYKLDLVLCPEAMTCPICFDEFAPNEGIILKECLHKFCRGCLRNSILLTDDIEKKCPFRDDNYSCPNFICEYEIKALLSIEEYEKRLDKTLAYAEQALPLTFHCKTPDCKGWCEIEPDAEEYDCPLCFATNCIICAVIHVNQTCEEYQQSLFNEMSDATIGRMLACGEAMRCPKCSALISKIDGCDGMKCAFCHLDICWVTKRPRWGPNGPGDYSGGCQCMLNGRRCHPDCGNCH